MFEMSATPTTRNAFDRAHAERGAALRSVWSWIFVSKVSR